MKKGRTPEPGSGMQRPALIIMVALFAISWLVFGRTIFHQFINYDDQAYVYENAMVMRGLTVYEGLR